MRYHVIESYLKRREITLLTRHFLVSGRVQGVGFRWATVQLARDLHLTGTVQNLETGQVAIVASGSAEVLDLFAHRLYHVNAWAQVTDLVQTELPAQHFADFQIII